MYFIATPLCKLSCKDEDVYVFYGDKDPQFTWDGTPAKVLHLSRADALSAARVTLKDHQEYLVLSDDFVWEESGVLRVVGGEETIIRTFPKLSKDVLPADFKEIASEGELTVYKRSQAKNSANVQTSVLFAQSTKTTEELSGKLVNSCGQPQTLKGDEKIYEISVRYAKENREGRKEGYDCILSFDYACESMELYVNGRKVNDYFYTGQKALFSLGYFDFPTKITAVLHPLHEGDHIYLQEWPKMDDKGGYAYRTVYLIVMFRSCRRCRAGKVAIKLARMQHGK